MKGQKGRSREEKKWDIPKETIMFLPGVFDRADEGVEELNSLDEEVRSVEESGSSGWSCKSCGSISEAEFDRPGAWVNVDEDYHEVTTNVRCWNCCQFFETVPIFAPVDCKKQTDSGRGGKTYWRYHRSGMFCSFPCCVRYLMVHTSNGAREKILPMLYRLFESLYDRQLTYIPPAMEKEELREFGGGKTREEYKEFNDHILKVLLGERRSDGIARAVDPST